MKISISLLALLVALLCISAAQAHYMDKYLVQLEYPDNKPACPTASAAACDPKQTSWASFASRTWERADIIKRVCSELADKYAESGLEAYAFNFYGTYGGEALRMLRQLHPDFGYLICDLGIVFRLTLFKQFVLESKITPKDTNIDAWGIRQQFSEHLGLATMYMTVTATPPEFNQYMHGGIKSEFMSFYQTQPQNQPFSTWDASTLRQYMLQRYTLDSDNENSPFIQVTSQKTLALLHAAYMEQFPKTPKSAPEQASRRSGGFMGSLRSLFGGQNHNNRRNLYLVEFEIPKLALIHPRQDRVFNIPEYPIPHTPSVESLALFSISPSEIKQVWRFHARSKQADQFLDDFTYDAHKDYLRAAVLDGLIHSCRNSPKSGSLCTNTGDELDQYSVSAEFKMELHENALRLARFTANPSVFTDKIMGHIYDQLDHERIEPLYIGSQPEDEP